jgi:precorrin-6Y C5,15-methyltransferase (decarboxylating)
MTELFLEGAMQKHKVYIIGIPPDGPSCLTPQAHQLIDRADLVFGGKRLLDMFPALSVEKVTIGNNLSRITTLIKKNIGLKQIVVLSSGDPNFFGIAAYLVEKLGKDRTEIIPGVSSMQTAFACIKESWSDATFVSVHSRPIEDIIETVRSHNKTGIFTDDKHSPAAIAGVLLAHGIEGYRGYICEKLGTEEQQIIEADLPELSRTESASPNILILLKNKPEKTTTFSSGFPGIPDNEFFRRKPKEGLITKQEIRAISLSKMRLTETSILWDIGAGSGAVSIEASFIAKRGRVYAIEKNETDISVIEQNIRKFHAYNVEIVHCTAPEKLENLPVPSSVFIGGSGGKMTEIIEAASTKLKPGGRIVINIVAIENLAITVNTLKKHGFLPEITLVNIARSTGITELTRFEALNPIYIISGIQPEAEKK